MPRPALTVTSRREGFRRAGRTWSTAPVTVPVVEFTEDEIVALGRDPMLVVAAAELPDGGTNTREGDDPGSGIETGPGKPDMEGDDPRGGSIPPWGDPIRVRELAVVGAISLLAPEDFTGAGLPKVSALEREIGADITRVDRDGAWKKYSGRPNATAETGTDPDPDPDPDRGA